jgi:hypothetical protein
MARWSDLDVSVRPEQILRMHYPDLSVPAAQEVRDTAAAMAAHALEIATPVAWVRQVPLRVLDDSRVEFAGGAVAASTTLAKALDGSGGAHLFLVTLGPRLDERVSELFDAMDGLEGLFLDTAGWVVAQSALSSVRSRLGPIARAEGFRLTRRMGPGYLDWPLEGQGALVRTLSGGEALPGIEVIESGAILPEKTITGLYGRIPLELADKEHLDVDQ